MHGAEDARLRSACLTHALCTLHRAPVKKIIANYRTNPQSAPYLLASSAAKSCGLCPMVKATSFSSAMIGSVAGGRPLGQNSVQTTDWREKAWASKSRHACGVLGRLPVLTGFLVARSKEPARVGMLSGAQRLLQIQLQCGTVAPCALS